MTLHALALALAAGAGATLPLAAPAAQDLPLPGEGFTWERVGDVGIEADDLAFDDDGTLWAAGIAGPYRLDLTDGFPGRWVRLKDIAIDAAILPLGTDTLVGTTGASTYRSLDGGYTWEEVYDGAGDHGLYEVPEGYPFAGRVLSGASQEIAYSADRAASFTQAVVPGQGGAEVAGAADFVSLPPGSSHPGRILAAGRWGVTVSDDGGATFQEGGLYRFLYYNGERLGVVERPGGGYRVIAGGWINMQPYERVWVSEDGGATWGPDSAGIRLPEGPPYGV
ncbi:MAG TPA: sialidase family protein, partial [Rubricoccaceae bacterium]|nr:sialidase family protein [Rubricoccaceae bacterium]